MKRLTNCSDEELLDLLKSDNQAALSVLFDRYWVKLLSVASHRLNDIALGEDCVQNVFLSLWERRHRLTIHQSLSNYLAVSVKYQVIKHIAAAKKNLQERKLRGTPFWFNSPRLSIALQNLNATLSNPLIYRLLNGQKRKEICHFPQLAGFLSNFESSELERAALR